MKFSDSFFNRVEKKTNVNKETILDLAQKLQQNEKIDFEYLTFKVLDKYKDKLTHFITLRHGGASKGVYSSLILLSKSIIK